MTKSKSEGYKLAKKFMNAKDIFRVVNNLEKVGYGISFFESTEDEPYFKDNYKNYLTVVYLEKQSFLKLKVYYKDRDNKLMQEYGIKDDFLQDIQCIYYY